MKNEIDVLRDVVQKLDQLKVDYMLTGSMAMIFYSKPRMTRDIDIIIELDKQTVRNFVELFRMEYYVEEDSITDSINTEFHFNLIHNESIIKIDFIIKKSSSYRKIEFSRRGKFALDNIDVSIVSKEDLIISKLFWAKDSNSEIQINDIKNLIENDYDKSYVENWVKELGLEIIWNRVKL